MARVIKAHKVGVLFIAIVLGAVVAASCLVDFGGGGGPPAIGNLSSSLSFQSDPSQLPQDQLVDDWFSLHFHHSPEDHPRWQVEAMVGLMHGLGALDTSTFELLSAIDEGEVDEEVYPSLSGLDKEDQTATVILAALALSEGFEGEFAQVVRLVYGDEKSVLAVALALNEANGSPIPPGEIETLPFLDH